MVIYTKLTVSGTQISDAKSATLKNAIGEYNASSRLDVNLDNINGVHKTDLPVGTQTVFWAGQVPTNGLYAYYSFSGNAKDEIGSNDGTVTGATLTSDKNGKLNSAYNFNFDTANINLGTSFNFSGDITLSAWVKPTDSGNITLFNKWSGSYTNFVLWHMTSYLQQLTIYNSGVGATVYSANALTPGVWTHIAVVISNGVYTFYKNGVAQESNPLPAGSVPSYSGTTYIGYRADGSIYEWIGDIDEFAFYTRALTDTELKNIYNNNNLTTCVKLFNGIITETKFIGDETNETVSITSRDWTAALQNVQIIAEVYTNQEISVIVNDLMTKYGPVGVTTTNVNVTSTTLSRIQFKQVSLFDALQQLSELANGYFFYVDVRKDLHFQILAAVSSAVTLDNTNTTSIEFKQNVDNVKNQIFVYGDRFFASAPTETFTSDGVGSVYTLKNMPYNPKVTVGGVIKTGGVYNQSTVPISGTNYLVSQLDSKIIWVSGTTLGYSSIPGSLTAFTVDYDQSLPIIKRADDFNSQQQYQVRTQTIINTDINDPVLAANIALSKLNLQKNPTMEANANLQGVVLLNPGESTVVNFPNKNQSNLTYSILESNYSFSLENNYRNEVLSVRLSKKVGDVTDTLKKMIIDIKKLQSAQVDTSRTLTRITSFTGSIGINNPPSGVNVVVRAISIGDSFILGHQNNGLLGLMNPQLVGSILNGANWVTGCGIGYNRGIYMSGTVYMPISGIGSQNNYSLSYWLKLSGTQNATDGNNIVLSNGTSFYQGFSSGTTGYYPEYFAGAWLKSTIPVTLGSYNHVVIVGSGTYGQFYVNGSNAGSVNGLTILPTNIEVGRRSDTAGTSQLWGAIDDLRIYNKSLSFSEVGSLYSQVNYPTGSLVGYWKFDEGSGTYCYSSTSGNAYKLQPLLGNRFVSTVIYSGT